MRAELDLDALRRVRDTVNYPRAFLKGQLPAILAALEQRSRMLEAVRNLRQELEFRDIPEADWLPAERTLLHLAGAGEEVRHG